MNTIDLRSDTVTQQPQSMREAMYHAIVGDDVYEEDPTIIELEELAAKMMGKEAAAFVCSGTMGNQLAIMSHTQRGDQILLGENSHVMVHEVGAPAILSSVTMRTIFNENDMIYPEDISKYTTDDDIHVPKTSLLCLENALANGTVVSLENMKSCYHTAKELGLNIHLDGARIFNAAEYLGCEVSEIASYADSVMFCLSKGLCAPVGSMLVGTHEFIKKAKKNRKLLGGGMRQAGFLAACGLIAINEMPKRLKEDHENAQYLASELQTINGFELNKDNVHINMLFFKVDIPNFDYKNFQEYLLSNNIKIGAYSVTEGYRFVTHYGIGKEDIDIAIKTIKDYFK